MIMKNIVVSGVVCVGLLGQAVFGVDKLPDDSDHQSHAVNYLKTGVAWGLVPLGSEVAINTLESYLKRHDFSFLLKLLAIHNNNIRRATSQHLTDNISARLESVSYKTLSDDHINKKTDKLQTDLLYRSLSTFSVLSLHGQKARKTFFRLLDIIDTVSSSASLAMSRGNEDRAAALIAFNAQSMVYLHPEATAQDVFDSVYINFSQAINWSRYPNFRARITDHLKKMDPLMQRSAIMGLRYCDMLNEWQVGSVDCSQQEAEASK